MKQPISELPFIYDSKTSRINDKNNVHIVSLEGSWVNDREYIIQACNNYPKAIELLTKLYNDYRINCYEKDIQNEIEDFLNSIENDNNSETH